MSQPYLIEQIIKGLGFNERTRTMITLAVASEISSRQGRRGIANRVGIQKDHRATQIFGKINQT